MTQLGFVFPGQGSQTIGMCADLAQRHGEVRATFALASEVLGYDLWQRVQAGPAAELNRTEVTQPALLTAAYATWQAWRARQGRAPDVLAGHSLGEYTALACAGVLDLTDAVKLVRQRGRLMQQAVAAGQGRMAAIIGLDEDAIAALCVDCAEGETLAPANYNSPGQVVIAGAAAAVGRACAAAKETGAKMVKRLDVSVPAHCALMRPAADKFADDLENIAFKPPKIPIIQNSNAALCADADAIRAALLRQLYSPVRWRQSILKMQQLGVTDIIECGPGKVLTGLNKRISKEITAHAVHDNASLEAALRVLAA